VIVGGFYPGSYYLQFGGPPPPTPTVMNCTIRFVVPYTVTLTMEPVYSASITINPDPE